MCGRYTVTSVDGLIEDLELEVPDWFEPRFNAAPTQELPVVVDRGDGPTLERMRWGLIPHWAKDPTIGHKMINARCESLADKPAFRDAFARRRCLVPADGFYEWRAAGKKKQPMWYHRADRKAFAFAGLWERWRGGPDAVWTITYTIVTGPPNRLVEPVHDRMPIIVAPADYRRWLHPEPLPDEAVRDILVPAPTDGYEIYDVPPRVGNVANDDPGCIERQLPVQPSLF
jgi:putative SOS response-associated peptidase YedK